MFFMSSSKKLTELTAPRQRPHAYAEATPPLRSCLASLSAKRLRTASPFAAKIVSDSFSVNSQSLLQRQRQNEVRPSVHKNVMLTSWAPNSELDGEL